MGLLWLVQLDVGRRNRGPQGCSVFSLGKNVRKNGPSYSGVLNYLPGRQLEA
jgi:hypothetical protein